MSENVRGTRADVAPSADAVDTEIVLRDPTSWWALFWALVAALVYWWTIEWIHPEFHITWIQKAIFGGVPVTFALVTAVLYPAWITIGTSGIEYGQWFRRRQIPWEEIDSFASGNPGRPEIAYVLVRGKAPSTAPRPIRLPRLSSHPPIEVVSILRARQRLKERRDAG